MMSKLKHGTDRISTHAVTKQIERHILKVIICLNIVEKGIQIVYALAISIHTFTTAGIAAGIIKTDNRITGIHKITNFIQFNVIGIPMSRSNNNQAFAGCSRIVKCGNRVFS